jgi:hypothetical protein
LIELNKKRDNEKELVQQVTVYTTIIKRRCLISSKCNKVERTKK